MKISSYQINITSTKNFFRLFYFKYHNFEPILKRYIYTIYKEIHMYKISYINNIRIFILCILIYMFFQKKLF